MCVATLTRVLMVSLALVVAIAIGLWVVGMRMGVIV